MNRTTKFGLWLFVPGASWTLLMVSGALSGIGNIDILAITGLLAMVAAAYGAFLLMFSGAAKIFANEKVRRWAEMVGKVVEMGWTVILAVVGLYIGYLFVSWAGLIGTLLTLITGLLFVIVAMLGRR